MASGVLSGIFCEVSFTLFILVQVLFKVFSGQKPDAPEDMPADYRRLMEDCWATDPAERPTFRDIIFRFRPMLAAAQAAAQQP